MPERLLIRDGRLIDPANKIDRISNLLIENGRVAAIDAHIDRNADEVIDASGQIVCPGLVDLRARLREPGLEHKASIASEALAAVRGGITTLACPPDTNPVIDTPAVVDLLMQRAQSSGKINLLAIGALTQQLEGEQLAEMGALQAAGCTTVSNACQPIRNALIARRAMEYAATFDLTVFISPLDADLAAGGCAHEGVVSTRLGLPAIPAAAETVALARDLALCADSGARVHVCGLSSAAAATMIARARQDGLPVSADVSVHQLFLSEHDVADFNPQCHVLPPFRSTGDRDALRRALIDGTIAVICSDHQPHEADAKNAPFPATEAGISALETLLPLTLAFSRESKQPLSDTLACVTCNPAQVLGIERGTLSIGAIADVCIFDPRAHWTLTAERMLSQGKNTPFLGQEMCAEVSHTLLAGQCVYHKPGQTHA
ncbi:MAG: dihydroorotase [gamma proteobacterium symbiont of Bathyaustriella thionipta]|nr:dihydroorotase [gamma proteobacterium symbiont of Bathyaustriella thionipta]